MVVCDTCGTGGQFRVVSGFYYCNVCDTQSQHAVEEEIELAFEEGEIFTQGRVVAGRANKGRISKRFRAYRRLNLYNDLLRKQVEELINLGAPPRFKVAVMELWFKYIDVLELDSEPYGKLPPFCLHEELEMATKKLKEESFSLKKAVYHHVPMRTCSQRKQKLGKRWCQSHPLYGYDTPKAPKINRTGLSEIMSDLSTIDRDPDTPSTSSVRSSVARELDESSMIGAADCSGFGFGSQDTTLFDFSAHSDVKQDVSMNEERYDSASFSFNMGSQEDSLLNCLAMSASLPSGEQTGNQTAHDGADPSQHIAGSMIEEVDLTSEIAYKLRAHMEARDITTIEKYIEAVLQMRCSCLVMILYLALIRAKVFHIGVVDLYRFIRQGHLTFREAREVASDELLKARRNIFFNMFLPEILPQNISGGAFLKSCAVLCGLLNISSLDLPPLNFHIARISLDLNLSKDIIALATSISTRYSLQPMWSLDGHTEFPHLRVPSVPHMEVEACAAILLALKYLVGLDGNEEYKASIMAERESLKGNQGTSSSYSELGKQRSSLTRFFEKELKEKVRYLRDFRKYFVISHWLTQLSRRAHFLRRRGEFFNAQPLDFDHIKSSAHLVRHDAKRRTDFYSRGMNSRRCQQFLDDLRIPNRVGSIRVSPSSFPMRSTIEQFLKHESAGDSLGLLEDMTEYKILQDPQEPRPYRKASRRQSKFFKETHSSFRPAMSKDASDGSHLAPSANLLILVQLLGEYCLSSGLMLHWALMRLESKVFGSGR